jgi:hypothetical protein
MILRSFSVIAVTLFFSIFAQAQTTSSGKFFRYSQTRAAVNYLTFSGAENESLSTNSLGIGGEVATKKGNDYVAVIGKVRGISTTGEEPFLDGATQTTLSYSMISVEAHLGFLFNLIPGEPRGFRPYIGATGIGGQLQLRFDADDVTTLKPSETEFYSGYEATAGVELYFKKGGGVNLWSVFGEISSRKVQADIAGKTPYYLDGLVITGGLAW